MTKPKVKVKELKYLYQLKHEMRCEECGKKITADDLYHCSACNTQNDYQIITPLGYSV